jgi:hypothetical protein
MVCRCVGQVGVVEICEDIDKCLIKRTSHCTVLGNMAFTGRLPRGRAQARAPTYRCPFSTIHVNYPNCPLRIHLKV